MKGIVKERFTHSRGYGTILGEDGVEYPFHYVHIFDNAKIKEGAIVRFEAKQVSSDGKKWARCIRKTGHGIRHPFIFCLKQIYTAIDTYVPEEEKTELLKDITAIIKYFTIAEDVETYPDIVNTFREVN